MFTILPSRVLDSYNRWFCKAKRFLRGLVAAFFLSYLSIFKYLYQNKDKGGEF